MFRKMPAKHMGLFSMLKRDHEMGHGHVNALGGVDKLVTVGLRECSVGS